jgi:hypothetical protein
MRLAIIGQKVAEGEPLIATPSPGPTQFDNQSDMMSYLLEAERSTC